MIKNIKHLKDFGIFRDYDNSNVQDFNRFNLIYGCNGSGKTTLVELFESLERKSLPPRFPSSQFSITVAPEGKTITHADFRTSNLNIYIFNDNFVKENIDWDNVVNTILLIAKEKIEERNKLNQLKEQQAEDIASQQKKENEITKLNKEVSDFMTNSARSIKHNLRAIDTSDNYFMNYDKRKFEKFIDEHKEEIKQGLHLLDEKEIAQSCRIVGIDLSELHLLDEEEVAQSIEGAKPNQKPEISFTLLSLDSNKFDKKKEEISRLLNKSIASKTIERLVSNVDIQTWVEEGVQIHRRYKSSECEFCGNQVSRGRYEELKDHFSDEYEQFKETLIKSTESIDDLSIELKDNLPDVEKFYTEFHPEFKKAHNELSVAARDINQALDKKWKDAANQKVANPFNTTLKINDIDETLIRKFNDEIKTIKNLVRRHNDKTNDFRNETNKNKKRLELHYATEQVRSFNYFQKQKDIEWKRNQNSSLKEKIDTRKQKIQQLEASLSNEGLGAEEFNSFLHKFIGRENLSLQFNKEKKGYDIIRDQQEGKHSKNLSEGEKRAIAFIYFITKLTEKNNKVEESIIVLDDPVSSFDSNHLFQAYSFLHSHCKEAKQLFIFTHNFTYFKLIRDWFSGNNKNRRRERKDEIAHFFTIETSTSNPRYAQLVNIDKTLIEYNSEYHYLFKKLLQHREKNTLNIEEAFLIANLSRRLLESFFNFKYPKHRPNLKRLLEDGLQRCEITTEDTKEKIYNSINKYSHSDRIETDTDSPETLMGESRNVIGDILKWIKEVDENHYKEMVEVINEN